MTRPPATATEPLSREELRLDDFWEHLQPYEIVRAWTQPRSGARCAIVRSRAISGDVFVKQTDDSGERPAWPEVHFATLLQVTQATPEGEPVVPPPVAWGNGPTYLAYHLVDGELVHDLLRDHGRLDADDRELVRECARTLARLHSIDTSEVRTFGEVSAAAGGRPGSSVLSVKDLGPWNCVASDDGPVVLIDTPVFQLAPPAHDVGRMTVRLARATIGPAGGLRVGFRTTADVVELFATTYRDSVPAAVRPGSGLTVLRVVLRELAIASLRDVRQGRWRAITTAIGMVVGAVWATIRARTGRHRRAVA